MEQINNITLTFKCPKAFNELQPCTGGWYCNGCHKLVHDMRGKSELEMLDIFAANNYKVCGLFEADRIRLNPPLPKWRKWAAAAVLTLGFTGLHQALIAQKLSKADSIALSGQSGASNASSIEANEIFGTAETSAEFPGGMLKFSKFVAANLKLETEPVTPGKAFLTFAVDADGSISDIKVLRSPFSQQINEQIIEMFKKSPRWRPGTFNGRAVRQQYTMPVALPAK